MNTRQQVFARQASQIRKLGGIDLLGTLRKVTKLLADHHIAHLVCGGFAVQEHGYARLTDNVNIIVPNRNRVVSLLLANHFVGVTAYSFTDPKTNAKVTLLRGGSKPTNSEAIPLPWPDRVSAKPILLTLAELITHKLSCGRFLDLADVVELIKANGLDQTFAVDHALSERYLAQWNIAQRELRFEAMMRQRDQEEEQLHG